MQSARWRCSPARCRSVDVSPDPADNFLLAMAVAGKADYLVTGDGKHLLSLRRHGERAHRHGDGKPPQALGHVEAVRFADFSLPGASIMERVTGECAGWRS